MPYKHKVGGSNPSSTTMKAKSPSDGALFVLSHHLELGLGQNGLLSALQILIVLLCGSLRLQNSTFKPISCNRARTRLQRSYF